MYMYLLHRCFGVNFVLNNKIHVHANDNEYNILWQQINHINFVIGSTVIAKLYFYLSFFIHFDHFISFPPISAILFIVYFTLSPSTSSIFPAHILAQCPCITSVDFNHLATIHTGSMLPVVNAHQLLTILPPNIRALFYLLLSMPISIICVLMLLATFWYSTFVKRSTSSVVNFSSSSNGPHT